MSWDFLVQLVGERRSEPSRPLLFVAHSLGGVFVKEALRRSANYRSHHTRLDQIFYSKIGIIFFGTPHGGADPLVDAPHRIIKRLAVVAGVSVNESVVNSLLPSAERLRELRDEFHLVADEQNWIIHSFQEDNDILLGNKKVRHTTP